MPANIALLGGVTPGYDVIVVAGQSNAVGADETRLPSTDDAPDSDITRWVAPACAYTPYASGYKSLITVAEEPLGHPAPAFGVGPGFAFAKAYKANGYLRRGRKILIVPTALGDTGLTPTSGNTWNPAISGSLLDQSISLTAAAITAGGVGSRVVAFLWVQGENDAVANITQALYSERFDALVQQFRSRIASGSTAPFVIGSMTPFWTNAPNGTSLQIAASHAAAPARLYRTAYVVGPTSSGIHYTAPEARILGARMFAAFKAL